MMEWLWTKDKKWFDKWDAFNASEIRGHYLQYSDWLFSYYEYGFDVELLVGLENDEICIGYGIVKARFFFLKFYVINCGPIVRNGYESYVEEAIKLFLEKSKIEGACYCHINLPVIKSGHFEYGLKNEDIPGNSIYYTGKPCTTFPFKAVASINGNSWIDLPPISEEERLSMFKSGKRKAIRVALRAGLTLVRAKTPEEIKMAYATCEQNALERGYTLRPWKEFEKYLVPMTQKGYCEFYMAFKDNDCKGALFVVKLNNRYHSNYAGFKREKPDLQVGNFLHWNVICMAMAQNMPLYDNSVGGIKTVREFKDSFDPVIEEFINGRYWVLSPFKYGIYNRALPFVRKNKRLISKVVKFFK